MKSDEFQKIYGNNMVIYIDRNYSELSGGIEGRRFAATDAEDDLDQRELDLKEEDTFLMRTL